MMGTKYSERLYSNEKSPSNVTQEAVINHDKSTGDKNIA